MNETAHEHVSLPSSPLEESAAVLTSSSPQRSSWWGGLVRRPLAWLRAVLGHPLRSLTIAVLLLLIGTGGSMAGMWLWASYHLRAGRTALERYHTAEAVQHLQAALSIWPRDPEALLLAARAARRSGAFEAADQFLDLYQQSRKEDEALTLERICLRAQRGEPDSVANYCRRLIEQNDPAVPLIYEAMAQGFARNYQPHKAESVLRSWLEQEPNNPQALLLQGQIFADTMRHTEAIKSYRAALMADPTLDEARLRLGEILMQLGSIEEAQPHLEYLRSRLPDNPRVQVYLARIQDRQGHSEEAERMLDEVLAHQPHFAPALVDRGILALRAGQFAEAEKYLRAAVLYDPSDFQAHDRLAFCLEQNGKLAEADKEREHLKQMEKDLKDIQDIAKGELEQRPHDPDLHYHIGMIALRAGAVAEGLRWLHNALKEDPNHQGAHKALAEHYQRIGDLSRAREHRQKLTK
jgi:predicted Zn-dependent protease